MGIFPYVLKLLQTTATDLRQTLVLIWAKIMAWDTNSQVRLHGHGLRLLSERLCDAHASECESQWPSCLQAQLAQ